VIHPVDRAAGLLFRFGPPARSVFADGWGKTAVVDSIAVDGSAPPPAQIEVTWTEVERTDDLVVSDGAFPSPAVALPDCSRTAFVRYVAPRESTGRLVVLMAAWNDHGYRTRSKLAVSLARRGITSVMLENPFYGARRRDDEQPIRTVADFAVMGRAAVQEGRALLSHFAPDHQVGVSGFSLGGNIAAMVGALMDQRVAIAPLAASQSPGPVWADGLIRHTVDADALGGARGLERLRAELSRATVLAVPPEPHTAGAVIVGGLGDGYIPRAAVEELHEHWPGSELRWVRAGHATMIWRHQQALVDAIDDSFLRTFRTLA
jgi:pimeloyl-ACP methyl ester carboxylesterase